MVTSQITLVELNFKGNLYDIPVEIDAQGNMYIQRIHDMRIYSDYLHYMYSKYLTDLTEATDKAKMDPNKKRIEECMQIKLKCIEYRTQLERIKISTSKSIH